MSSSATTSPYLSINSEAETDRRRRLRVWLTIPLFCLCFMALGHDFGRSLLFDEGFNLDETEMQELAEQGMLKYRIAFVSIALVGGLLLVAKGGDPIRPSRLLAFCILATVSWSCMSVTWSIDPGLTLRRVFTLLCSFLGVMGIARVYRAIDICWLGFVFTLLMTVLGLISELAVGTFRPWESTYRFAGLVHPNTQGIELSILMLTSVILQRHYPKWRSLFIGIIAAAFIGLILTKSRTSAACCILGFIALWAINSSARVKIGTLLAVTMVGGLFLGAVLTFGVDDPERFSQVLRMGRDEDIGSFTGRIPIWVTLMEDVSTRPLAGYGFNSYFDESTLAYIAKQHEWAVPNAHNAYIETALNSGFIGLGLLLTTILVGMVLLGTARVRAADAGYSLFFALTAFALLNGVFESAMVINFNFAPSLLAAGFCRLAFFEDLPGKDSLSSESTSAQRELLF